MAEKHHPVILMIFIARGSAFTPTFYGVNHRTKRNFSVILCNENAGEFLSDDLARLFL